MHKPGLFRDRAPHSARGSQCPKLVPSIFYNRERKVGWGEREREREREEERERDGTIEKRNRKKQRENARGEQGIEKERGE